MFITTTPFLITARSPYDRVHAGRHPADLPVREPDGALPEPRADVLRAVVPGRPHSVRAERV